MLEKIFLKGFDVREQEERTILRDRFGNETVIDTGDFKRVFEEKLKEVVE